jgi:hypothetical protein
MAKNKEGNNGLIEKLAMISEDISKVFPKSKSVVVYSMTNEDFNYVKAQVGNFDSTTTQFKIDISGIEFIFLKDELLKASEGNS